MAEYNDIARIVNASLKDIKAGVVAAPSPMRGNVFSAAGTLSQFASVNEAEPESLEEKQLALEERKVKALEKLAVWVPRIHGQLDAINTNLVSFFEFFST